MADETGTITPAQIQSSAAAEASNAKADEVNGTIKTGIADLEEMGTEALEELRKELLKSLGKFQKDIVSQLEDENDEFKSIKAIAQELVSDQTSGVSNIVDAKESILKGKKNPNASDILKLSGRYSLGPLFIVSELETIRQDLLKFFKGFSDKKSDEKSADLGGKDSKLAQLKGLPEMVGTFKDFAKTMILFRLFNNRIADAGMDVFENVVSRYNTLANDHKDDFPRWAEFSKIVHEMVSGLKQYSIALLIIALTSPFLLLAIPAAFGMVAFFGVLSLVTKLVKPLVKGGIKDFAFAALLLSGAFLIMAGAMIVIAKWVAPNIGPALLGMAAITGIIYATAAIGKFTKSQATNFKQFAIGMVILAGAYAAFSVAMLILAQLGWGIVPATIGLAFIDLVLFTTVQYALITKSQAANFKQFAIGAAILGGAYAAFGVAMHILAGLGALGFVKAIFGIELISLIIDCSIEQGKKLGENSKNFMYFAAGAALLGVAYMAFGVALKILESVGWIGAVKALPGLLLISSVVMMSAQLGDDIKDKKSEFVWFAGGMIMLGIAYMAFGGAMTILAEVGWKGAAKAFPALALITGIIVASAQLGDDIKDKSKDILFFAVGSVILGVAYMAFGGALHIMASLGDKMAPALIALVMVAAVLGLTIAMAQLVKTGMVDFVIFAAGCAVLAVAYMLFGVALVIMSKVGENAIPALIGLGISLGVIALSIGIGILFASGGIMAVAAFAAGASMLGVAYLLLGASLLLLGKVGEMDKAKLDNAMTLIKDAFWGTAKLAGPATLAMLSMVLVLPAALMLAMISLPLRAAFEAFAKIAEVDSKGITLASLSILAVFAAMSLIGKMAKFATIGVLAAFLLSKPLSSAIKNLSKPVEEVEKLGQLDTKNILLGTLSITALISSMALIGKVSKLAITGVLALLVVSKPIEWAVSLIAPSLQKLEDIGSKLSFKNILKAFTALTLTMGSMVAMGFLGGKAIVGALLTIPFAGVLWLAVQSISPALKSINKLGSEVSFRDMKTAFGAINLAVLNFSILGIPAMLAMWGAAEVYSFAALFNNAVTSIALGVKTLSDNGKTWNSQNVTDGLTGLHNILTHFKHFPMVLANANVNRLQRFANKFSKTISALTQPIKDATLFTSDLTDNIRSSIEFYKSSSMDSFVEGTIKLGGSMQVIGSSLGKLSGISKFNVFVNSLNKLTQAEAAIDKLNQFAQNADAFNNIASSFERMANSFDEIAGKERKVRGLFDTLSKAKMEMNTLTESTPQAMGGTVINPFVEKIYTVIDKWDKNGVPIRGGIDGANMRIVPNDVGNKTGIRVKGSNI